MHLPAAMAVCVMDAMNDDEVFAVIGHELGHLINKDVRDAYRAAYLVVAARYGIAAVNTTAGALSTGFLGDLGQELASRAYSRRQETQADETAFQFCVQNGVDPYAMYHALNVLIQLSGENAQQGKLAELLFTHPNTQKRAEHTHHQSRHRQGQSNFPHNLKSVPIKIRYPPPAREAGARRDRVLFYTVFPVPSRRQRQFRAATLTFFTTLGEFAAAPLPAGNARMSTDPGRIRKRAAHSPGLSLVGQCAARKGQALSLQ